MKRLKISILSWLVFHANTLGKNQYFYRIKNKILNKFGEFIDYDIQFIEGKKCNCCNGTGIYKSSYKLPETCWGCVGTGWYKSNQWNVLSIIKIGKYKFHQPFYRSTIKPSNIINPIIGYIDHKKSKYADFSLFVLFLIYEKGYLKRYYKESGGGWKLSWYLPKNWAYNFIHILKHGLQSYPIRHFKEAAKFTRQSGPFSKFETDDELPF